MLTIFMFSLKDIPPFFYRIIMKPRHYLKKAAPLIPNSLYVNELRGYF